MDDASKKGVTSLALVGIACAFFLATSCQTRHMVSWESAKAALEERDQAIAVLAAAVKELQNQHKGRAKWTVKESK